MNLRGEGIVDKSGVKPTSISLPSGAGSIEGLGESFQPQLNTGSSSYGLTIALPPGRAGLQPHLHLAYNSGLGNSYVGLGWTLEISSIRRRTDKGFPAYSDQDVFVFGGEELVPLSNPDGDWRTKNEGGFQRFRRRPTVDGGVYWEMTEHDGTRHLFGQHQGTNSSWSVVVNPGAPSTGSSFDNTYCWSLDTTIDVHGNRIEYEYFDPNSTPGSAGVLYPQRIRYSFLGSQNWQEVQFEFEDRPDKFEDYRPTFAVITGRRLLRIVVVSHHDGIDNPVRSYDFQYEYQPEDGIVTNGGAVDLGVSTLKRVVQRDRSGQSYLPPLLFRYSELDLSRTILSSLPPSQWSAMAELADPLGQTQIADVNGDGLPDLFQTVKEDVVTTHYVSLNQGVVEGVLSFAPRVALLSQPDVLLNDPEVSLTDLDGDGLVDIVRVDAGNEAGKQLQLFRNRASLVRPSSLPPGFGNFTTIFDLNRLLSFQDPNIRQMDVNFDKASDFISMEPGPNGAPLFHLIYRDSIGSVWITTDAIGPADMPNQGFAESGTSNPRVFLADMNGDRLQDLVIVDNDGSGGLIVSYWPYAGLGRWGERHAMQFPVGDPRVVRAIDPRDVFIQDFTGDGLADLVVMQGGSDQSQMILRVNVAGAMWSAETIRQGLPYYGPRDPNLPTVFRQADLNGNGSTDLIWRNTSLDHAGWDWLELMPDGKPNLLVQIDNSMGKITEITYGSSSEDLIRAMQPGPDGVPHPWQQFCPFPVQVVRRIRTTCGLDLDGLPDPPGYTTDQYVSEFHYRDAYYDAFEREFRGFAFAERIDYGDDVLWDSTNNVPLPGPDWDGFRTPTFQVGAPTSVTRYRYLTGAPEGLDLDEEDQAPGLPTDPVTPLGGHEKEILKGRQVWEEKVDAWVLWNPGGLGDFDRGCYLAVTSTNALERGRVTPDDYVYSRASQQWSIRRLYRPTLVQFLTDDGLTDPAPPVPAGRFHGGTIGVDVLDGLGGSGRSVAYAFVSAATNEVIEANGVLSASSIPFPFRHPARNPLVTAQHFDHDDYGNEILNENLGVVNDDSYTDQRVTVTEYVLDTTALAEWITSRPASVKVQDDEGNFVARSNYYYDGDPFVGLPYGHMGSRGLLHRTEQLVTGPGKLPVLALPSNLAGDPRSPSTTALNTVRSAYDIYGNVTNHLDALGDPAHPEAGHARIIDYDPAFATYPVRETNQVGNGKSPLVMRAAYDPGFGVLTNSIDFNGNPSSFEYDGFARLVAIVKPGDSHQFPTATFEYQPADPTRDRLYVYDAEGGLKVVAAGVIAASRVTTRLREQPGQPGTFVSATYSDGAGRKLASVTEGDSPGRWIVSAAHSYNRRMGNAADWQPYDVSLGADDAQPPQFGDFWPAGRPQTLDLRGHAVVKADRRYDGEERAIATVNAPESFTDLTVRTISLTQLLPLEKRLFDENDADPASPNHDTPMVQKSDGLGRLIEVDELTRLSANGTPANDLAIWPTVYQYDLNDNLTHITDSQGNQKWFRYDGLKRKLFMNDPDRGTVTYSYDDASNLRETVDAKGQHIQYSYDGVNRLLTEDYLDDDSPEFSYHRSPDVVYHYDNAVQNVPQGDGTKATARNTRGFLAWVEDASGEEHTSYDARGRVEWTVKRLPDPQFLSSLGPQSSDSLVSYRTEFAYDSLDRVTTLTYPDKDYVEYSYNSRSLVRAISGGPSGYVISNITYQPSAQLARIDYGNGVRTTYNYDPRLRLNNLLTVSHPGTANLELIDFSYDFDGVSNIRAIRDNRPISAVAVGDPRRNTQIFNYDDLYRITYAGYAFGGPGSTNVDGGSIKYRYDRIGNMLAQTSTITNTDSLTGLPVADLGAMDSGGSAGRSNRIGRNPADPPGPHALTSIANPKSQIPNRAYPYDPNGNMTVIDELTNTWDFKDRLVEVENSQVRAEYTYDYTDRRVVKRVWPKSATNSQPSSVLYPSKYFEVREHDAPVKYVWNGNARVARVTGSLNTSPRVQRVRLWPGYNLISVAVGAASFPASPQISAAYLWNQATLNWRTVVAGTVLGASSVLWVQMATNGTLTFTGNYSDPTNSTVAGGPNFLPVPGLQTLTLTNSNAQLAINEWRYDAQNQLWQIGLVVPLTNLNSLPPTLAPGEVTFVRAEAATQMMPTDPTLRVNYYHEDHLGSLSVLSDSTGVLVAESENYAFGSPRNTLSPRNHSEVYQFTQKEKDAETSYYYFESRFYAPIIARFIRTDKSIVFISHEWLTQPQKLNCHVYCRNNPLQGIDPTGCTEESPSIINRNRDCKVVRYINPQPGGPGGPTITFVNDEPRKPSPNKPVSTKTADMVEMAVVRAGVESVNINSSTGGKHDKNSRHYQDRAVDINKINGESVKSGTRKEESERLQDAFRGDPNIRENFGPTIQEKTIGTKTTHKDNVSETHDNHIHVSGQQ